MDKIYSQCCGYLALQQENDDWVCQNCEKRCKTRVYSLEESYLEIMSEIKNKLQEILEAIKSK